jgi:hypothetical protein
VWQRIEAAVAENGANAGKILGEAGENAEPILAVIDFQAFEGSEAVVGLDETGGDPAHGASVGSEAAHALVRA